MKKTMIALALAAASFAANASESNGIGYTYAQLDYTYQDADYAYFNGGVLSGSFAVNDNVFLTASYGKAGDTVAGAAKLDSEDWSVGVGLNNAIGTKADWVTQVAYAHSEYEVRARGCTGMSGCSYSENLRGGKISTGVLGKVADRVTANAYLGYEDYNHGYEGGYFADFGAVYAFNDTWGMHGGLKLSDGAETYSLGVRASF